MQSGDSIDTLPVDKNTPSATELQLINTVFREQPMMQKLLDGTKDILVLGLLFIGFSLPQVDEAIQKVVPSTRSSPYILLMVKAMLFMFIFFIIKNMYLVRK